MKTFFLTLLTSFVLVSCSKDDEPTPVPTPKIFAEIAMSHIKENETYMQTASIQSSDNSGLIWQVNDVYIFKTRNGFYGKFQVIAIQIPSNYQLDIRATVYNLDGSIKIERNIVSVRGTWGLDLETMTETADNADFIWSRPSAKVTNLYPEKSAKFVKYIFIKTLKKI